MRLESKTERIRSAGNIVDMTFYFTVESTMLIAAIWLYKIGKITIGDFAFLYQLGDMIYFVFALVNDFMNITELQAKMSQAIATIMVGHEINDSVMAVPIKITEGKIEFKNVCFKYKNTSSYVFRNLNFSIESNQTIGLVGHSGAGKSTLVSLLLRTQDVESGEIKIDGYNIKDDATQKSLRAGIAYVPQDPMLFHRTVKENIMYGNASASFDEMVEACKKAYCYDFINNLEKGFDTLVGERGIQLSGGQRQRVAIARAILKNSKIIILDEATSSLDSVTEKIIQKAIKNLVKNKTAIIIAHRLSTLNNVDRIIVLDKGRIIEDGKFGELIEKNGLFTQLWETQQMREENR
jgi:ATP-binding cassette subfamily B protein